MSNVKKLNIPDELLVCYIHHSLQQFITFLVNNTDNFTFYIDLHPLWNTLRYLHLETSSDKYNVVFCGYENTMEIAMMYGVPYCISILDKNSYNTSMYVEFPLFHMLRILVRIDMLPFLSVCSLGWIPSPEPIHLYFNSSKYKTSIVTRFSSSKFGPSGLIYINLANNVVRCLNDTNISHLIYEDPRVFIFKNTEYVVVTVIKNYRAGVHTSCRIGYFPVESSNSENDLIIPLYGKNIETGPEKNWGFFEGVDGGLYVLYSYNPWTILRIHTPTNVEEVRKDSSIQFANRTHGGACPVRIGDSFWAFGRSEGGILCVVFDALTFRIKARCIPSFLSAKAFSYMHFFIGSAEYDSDKKSWTCVGGFNDAGNCILSFPHVALTSELVSVDSPL